MLGTADVKVGRRALSLVIDNAALIAAERAGGCSFLELAADLFAAAQLGRPPRLGTMQPLLFGATRARHVELTADACGALFLRHVGPLTEAVNAALIEALPKAEEDEEEEVLGEAGPAGDGTGTTPSPDGSKPAVH